MEPDLIDRSVEKTNVWLKEVAAELGVEDRRYSLRVLRAFLHTLRELVARGRARARNGSIADSAFAAAA